MSGSYAYGGNPPDIESAYHYGGGGLGVLGADVPSTGDDGTPYMYESVINRPGYATKEYIGYVDPATVPAGLTLDIGEASDFTASGPNGSYPVPWLFRETGSQIGSGTFTVNIGVTSTVSGVTVSPSAPTVAGGATQQFAATVAGTNAPSQAVTWSASAGSINSSGLFTAPAATGSAQTITITATSTANNTKSGTATVTVPAASASPTVSGVTVSPATATVPGTGTQQFTATVAGTNSPSQSVTWQASAGSITSGGLFTAPAATSSDQAVTITATSVADNTKSDTSTATVPAAAPVGSTVSGVTVTPDIVTVAGGAAQQFTATVQGTNSPSQAVIWSVTGGGSISSLGVYTAPAATDSAQSPVVTATSVQNSTKSDNALITVPAAVSVELPSAISRSIFSVEVPIDGAEGVLDIFPKQPAEVMDYDISFVRYLEAINDTVANVMVTAQAGITLLTHSLSAGVVKVWAAEGTNQRRYKFTIRLTTSGGRLKEVEFLIKVKET